MATVTASKKESELWSQSQAAKVLRLTRDVVRAIAVGLNIEYKRDPRRAGLLMDRRDIQKLADFMNVTPDWDAPG
jgi:hypothetical protein